MAKNECFSKGGGCEITLNESDASFYGAALDSDEPVAFSELTGVALIDFANNADGVFSVCAGFEIEVTGQDDGGNSAIIPGDPLYFHSSTGVTDRARNDGEFIGWSMNDVASGESDDICVLLAQDPDYTQFWDAMLLEFGDSLDVKFQWDGTNFLMTPLVDDTLWEIGDADTPQLSFDVRWYGGTAAGASYLQLDAGLNMMFTEDVDIRVADDDILSFGDADDVTVTWDGTNLIIGALADDSIIEIGDAAATQLSFDVRIYGDAAAGADYLSWDAGNSYLTTVGAAYIWGRLNDANGIGLALGVKSTAGAPGVVGTPDGSVIFNTNDDKIYVCRTGAWVASAALT